MNYFKGSVIEAITEAKKNNVVFIVFIYDKSKLSESTRNDLKKEELARTLSSLKYIAIEIENGSKDAIQFAQIYPLVVVPSLFFISPQSGVPLEVIAGNIDCKVLEDKVKNINATINKDICAPSIETNNDPSSKTEDSVEEEEAIKQNDQVEESVEPAPLHPTEPSESQAADDVATASAAIEVSTSEPSPSVEERSTRAKELISQMQEVKAQQEMEEEKKKEIDRRHQSSEMAKAKQKREEQERFEISRQRKKDKEEERLARERVKAQIAADRAERQARLSLLKGEEPSAPPRPIQEAAPPINNQEPSVRNRNQMTRIKFRFPDNSSELSQFRVDTTLMQVQNYLIENAKVPFSKFKMVGTLPPRTFTDVHMPQTLEHLGLTPSAIIIIKPMRSETSSSIEPLRKSIILFVWSMFTPLIVLYQYLRGFLGLESGEEAKKEQSSDEEDVQSSKRPRTEASSTTRDRPKTAYGKRGEGGSAFLRREGNIHRLNRREDEEDDDENNTWNGNSTQQM